MVVAMEVLFCIMIFCMGAVFGSFFTLTVYRIPLGLDITHERSFCPNCNHRLEFIDLIPILSYLSLGGKCRYCGQPVRIRYLVLEILSGIVFLTAYFAFPIHFPFLEASSLCLMIAFVMFYITNAIILGIDKEYIAIENKVLLVGIVTQTIYMLYLYTFEQASLIFYLIFLVMLLLLFSIDTWTLKKKNKSLYLIQIFMLFVYEVMFIQDWRMILGTVIGSCISYSIYRIIKRKNVPIGFCIALSSIISVLVGNLIM